MNLLAQHRSCVFYSLSESTVKAGIKLRRPKIEVNRLHRVYRWGREGWPLYGSSFLKDSVVSSNSGEKLRETK